MRHQGIAITGTIVIQTAEIQQDFETGIKGGYVAATFASS
jgi:hypothetical protein